MEIKISRQDKLNKWIVLWSAIGISMILGILYVWSVIGKGLMNELHWTSTQASLPYTAFTVCMAIGFFTSGRVQDKLGPRIMVTICAIGMGAGLILSGLLTDIARPWMVVIGFGVICGFGVGSGNAASLAPALKWWPSSKKGMVSGAVLAGIAICAIIYALVSNALLGAIGVSNSFLIFGVASFILMLILSFNMYNPPQGYDKEIGMVVLPPPEDSATVKDAPTEAGLQAENDLQATEKDLPAAKNNLPATENDIPTKEMVKTRNFYLVFAIFAISAASGLMIIAHAAEIAQVQIGWAAGFILVIVLNVFNALGRFLGGTISDKFGRVNTLKVTLVIQAVNMVCFALYGNIPLVMLGILIQGFNYGTIFAVMPSLVTDLYGYKHFGSNYGLIFLAWGVAGIIGPMTAATVLDASGAFNTAYLIACALSVISFGLSFALKKQKK